MKRLILGAATSGLRAAICAAFAAPAFGADLPPRSYTKAPSQTAPDVVYDWTGFYVGGHIGGGVVGPDSLGGHNGRLLGGGGIQFGYDRQFAPNWVSGAELQITGLAGNGHDALFPGGTLVTTKTNVLASYGGRIGYTWGPALLYAKAGAAFRDNTNINASVGGVPVAVTADGRHHNGITVGGGFEYMFAPNWAARAEYQYYNFGDSHFTGGPAALIGSKFHNDEHTVKLGVDYRFKGI